MVRRLGSVLAALLVAGVLASAGVVAPVAAASPGPQGRDHRGTGRGDDRGVPPRGSRGGRRGPSVHARRHRDLLPERDVAGRQGGPPGRLARRLHGPRQRLAEPLPRRALSAHAERLRAQPERRRERLHASVLRGEPDRGVDQAREGRGRPAPPPVLRQRPVGAGPARGDPRPGEAARRQLRGRVHRRWRVGGHRRGV